MAVIFSLEDFRYIDGLPVTYVQSGPEKARSAVFCSNSGTGFGNCSPASPTSIIVKVATFDERTFFIHGS